MVFGLNFDIIETSGNFTLVLALVWTLKPAPYRVWENLIGTTLQQFIIYYQIWFSDHRVMQHPNPWHLKLVWSFVLKLWFFFLKKPSQIKIFLTRWSHGKLARPPAVLASASRRTFRCVTPKSCNFLNRLPSQLAALRRCWSKLSSWFYFASFTRPWSKFTVAVTGFYQCCLHDMGP